MSKVLSIIKTIKQTLEQITIQDGFYTDVGSRVYFMRQWFDFRDAALPALSYFILEESQVEHKACSYKQELSLKVEAYTEHGQPDHIFDLTSDVKKSLLSSKSNLAIDYLGYEITLPEEGSNLVSVILNFRIHYIEHIQ
jgi:hypothetical protein